MLRKIYRGSKYSYVISIPKTLLKLLGWKSGQYVEVSKKRNRIEVKDAR